MCVRSSVLLQTIQIDFKVLLIIFLPTCNRNESYRNVWMLRRWARYCVHHFCNSRSENKPKFIETSNCFHSKADFLHKLEVVFEWWRERPQSKDTRQLESQSVILVETVIISDLSKIQRPTGHGLFKRINFEDFNSFWEHHSTEDLISIDDGQFWKSHILLQ